MCGRDRMGLHGQWCVCVCVYFVPAPRGCPSCQSCSVCAALWTEACSGRNLGRHSAPLKSFSQTRQSGTRARVQRKTSEQHVLRRERVCMTESVRVTDRGQKEWDAQLLALVFWIAQQKSFPSLAKVTSEVVWGIPPWLISGWVGQKWLSYFFPLCLQ